MKPRILCVDDEPHVLSGLRLHLRRHADVHLAGGAAEALERLESAEEPFAVVMSDLRMPDMDGMELLDRIGEVAPDAVRILLTGHADLDTALAVVNETGIFRLLTKPCPPSQLVEAFLAAAEQHRLITSERVLLQETLRGAVKALARVLALVQPEGFGRAERLADRVRDLAVHVEAQDPWQVEVAALLSEMGTVTLPAETVRRLHTGRQLSRWESEMAARMPQVVDELLGPVPRLENVREIVRLVDKNFDGSGDPPAHRGGREIPWGARALRIVRDFDVLEAGGAAEGVALEFMRSRRGLYDAELLDAFARLQGGELGRLQVDEIPLRTIREGMTFAEDVLTASGTLLVARGHAVNRGLIERVRNLPASVREMTVKVLISVDDAAEGGEDEGGDDEGGEG